MPPSQILFSIRSSHWLWMTPGTSSLYSTQSTYSSKSRADVSRPTRSPAASLSDVVANLTTSPTFPFSKMLAAGSSHDLRSAERGRRGVRTTNRMFRAMSPGLNLVCLEACTDVNFILLIDGCMDVNEWLACAQSSAASGPSGFLSISILPQPGMKWQAQASATSCCVTGLLPLTLLRWVCDGIDTVMQ